MPRSCAHTELQLIFVPGNAGQGPKLRIIVGLLNCAAELNRECENILKHKNTFLKRKSRAGVFRISGELPRVGDYLLAVPGHICPTTIRYPGVHVLDSAGQVVEYFLHTSRDRL